MNKPGYGEPCNRCGQCCMKYPCPVAQFLFKQKTGRCPALQANGDHFDCGLIADPGPYVPECALPAQRGELSRAARVLVDAGNGCDAQFVGEPINDAYRAARIREATTQRDPPDMEWLGALRVWGMELRRV